MVMIWIYCESTYNRNAEIGLKLVGLEVNKKIPYSCQILNNSHHHSSIWNQGSYGALVTPVIDLLTNKGTSIEFTNQSDWASRHKAINHFINSRGVTVLRGAQPDPGIFCRRKLSFWFPWISANSASAILQHSLLRHSTLKYYIIIYCHIYI